MKHIYRLLASAILLIITAACNNEEIETPQSPDQQQSDFRITASIIQTRVAYNYSDLGTVTQEWEEGDILFGFYGGVTSNPIVFEVSDVDSNTGVATLEAVSGADWIEEATVGGTQVDLVYTGEKDLTKLPFTNNGINVDLSGQTLNRVPGCMHAHAELQVDGDGNKSLEFNFQNDCALIEIDSLTGFAENWPGVNETSLPLSAVHITNLLLGGSYSFSGETLIFESNPASLDSEYEFGLPTGWTVSKDGDVSGPKGEKILIAVAPNSTKEEISVCAANSTEVGLIKYSSYSYGERSLAGGRCYVISAQPVVAKTADGECFKTVEEAFNHAKVLSESGYGSAAQNVVTLIKKEINGFGEQTSDDSQHMVGSYDIDYNVTLDLNGCTFILSGSEGFYVTIIDEITPATFTITDSNGLDNLGKYIGTISSDSGNSIFENFGVVNINGGNFILTSNTNLVKNYGTVNIDGGFLESQAESDEYSEEYYSVVFNDEGATLNISGGTLCSHNCCTVENYSVLTVEDETIPGLVISGGTIESENLFAIYNEEGAFAQILGGTIEAHNYDVIDNYGELTIGEENPAAPKSIMISSDSRFDDTPTIYCSAGGTLNVYYGTITNTGGGRAIEFNKEANGYVCGGIINNKSNTTETIQILRGAKCTISGGVIYSEGDIPTVACRSEDSENPSTLTVTWPGGEAPSDPLSDTRHEPIVPMFEIQIKERMAPPPR